MNGYEVACFEHVVHFFEDGDEGDFRLCRFREIRVVSYHLHTERICRGGDFSADCAKSQDTESFAEYFVAGKLRFAFFHLFFDVVARKRVCPFVAFKNISGGDEHCGDDELFYGVGVSAGGVEYDYAFFGVFVAGYVVDACSGSCHALEGVGDRPLVHYEAANQNRIGIFTICREGIAVF